MAARTYRLFSPYERTPPSRRAVGFVLALALNLLLILALLGISGYRPVAIKDDGGTLIFDIARQDQAAAPQPKPEQQRRKQEPQRERPTLPPPEIILPVKPTITPPPTDKLEMVELTKPELESTDQAMANRSAPTPAEGTGRGGDTAIVGTGPRGETLYAAEWLREPTDQEMGFYLTPNIVGAGGYGLIACKTYPRFRVDDCYAIESYPKTSQIARAALKATWQFKVRPPRKNGQPMIGEWVSIRIDYTFATRTQ